MRLKLNLPTLVALLLLLVACSPSSIPTNVPTPSSSKTDICPSDLISTPVCYTPHSLRVAYSIETLTEHGFTGKGQTVIDIVSYGSPTLQQDMDVFDKQFGLPPIHIQVVAPLGIVPFNSHDGEMIGWAQETELDVQMIHAIAPDAAIVVMTSPVDETQGITGLPEFLKLEQFAVSHHLGQIFSQSWSASEATLADQAGQHLLKTYADFYRQITTQEGFTIVTSSGDNGATDWADIDRTRLSSTPTVNFPADVPWVTAVGGTTLTPETSTYDEIAWTGSGGGVSKFFAEPAFQKALPKLVQSQLLGHRGLPDVAADANGFTGMAFYYDGQWTQTSGTSASAPLWAGLIADANQMAGHPLGFINPGIYKLGASPNAQRDFRDIVKGSNAVTHGPPTQGGTLHLMGFQAVAGWDAVTGWGTPQASLLIPDLIAALKV